VAQYVKARAIWKIYIQQYAARLFGFEFSQSFGDSCRFEWREVPGAQGFTQRPPNRLVVIDYKYLLFGIFRQIFSSLSFLE
jgi:hypothetical protein